MQFIYNQDRIMETIGAFDVVYFKMGKRDNLEGPFDVSLVEGGITSPEDIIKLKSIREKSRILVAFGACAVDTGLLSIKNWIPEKVVEEKVYANTSVIHSIKAQPIDEFVKVNFYLKGCPVDEDEMLELFSAALLDRKPYLRPHAVCVECKLKENVCLLVASKEPCMGPVTNAGCGAVCVSNKKACFGCRGPMNDPNPEALAELFRENGLSPDDIKRKFTEFASVTKAFSKGAEAA